MNFKRNARTSDLPEVNLVPMMDVLMTVLTFFIIISMTLTGQQIAGLNLPETRPTIQGTADTLNEDPLVVGLNGQSQLILNGQTITTAELVPVMTQFLTQNPDGIVLLKADRSLSYRQVNEVLKTLRDIGGSRVSLAFERTS